MYHPSFSLECLLPEQMFVGGSCTFDWNTITASAEEMVERVVLPNKPRSEPSGISDNFWENKEDQRNVLLHARDSRGNECPQQGWGWRKAGQPCVPGTDTTENLQTPWARRWQERWRAFQTRVCGLVQCIYSRAFLCSAVSLRDEGQLSLNVRASIATHTHCMNRKGCQEGQK